MMLCKTSAINQNRNYLKAKSPNMIWTFRNQQGELLKRKERKHLTGKDKQPEPFSCQESRK
jgi:hypothetical protein